MARQFKTLKNKYTLNIMRMIKEKLSKNAINPIAYILQDTVRLKYSASAYLELFLTVHDLIGAFAFACVCNLQEREAELYQYYAKYYTKDYEEIKHFQMVC